MEQTVLETSAGLTHIGSALGTLLSFKILSCQGNDNQVDLTLRANEESSLCAAWAASMSKYCGESQEELLVCDSNQPNLETSSLSWLLATSQRLPYFARVSARLPAQEVGHGEGTRQASVTGHKLQGGAGGSGCQLTLVCFQEGDISYIVRS